MEKRAVLGVRKRKKPIKRNKKTLLNKVVNYLKSDSYLYAPLISPPLLDFLASRPSSTGVELKDNIKCKNKSLVERVGEYLKSDSYFYAPLFAAQPIISSQGIGEYMKGMRIQLSTSKSIKKGNESTVEKSKVTVEKQLSEGDVSGQEKLVHKETVKHMVFQSCRSSSVSGKRVLDRPTSKEVSY